MDETKQAVNTPEPAAVQTDPVTVVDDAEAKVAALEAEKAKLIEERDNYKAGMLKAKGKAAPAGEGNEDDEDKMRRIAAETLANSRLADITREQNDIIQKTLKENKELKLAQMNKKDNPVGSMGAHSEAPQVRDTLISADQMAFFKNVKKWSDADIERYKKNLQKSPR